jgi:hypothetical protein
LLGPTLIVMAVGGAVYVPLVVIAGGSPQTTHLGYMPDQPVEYSHQVHVGQLGMDCRYCHTTVDKAGFAAIPPTQTCMNCHVKILPDSPKMLPVRESYTTGKPIEWVKVHDLPDYVYFDHSAHVNKGVSCVSCHGRVDKMEKVYLAETLSMSWCLDCHREPEKHLRPVEHVTDLAWQPEVDQLELGRKLKEQYNIRDSKYLTNCTVCHR